MDRHVLDNDLLSVEIRALGAAVNRLVAHTPDGQVDLLLGQEVIQSAIRFMIHQRQIPVGKEPLPGGVAIVTGH